MLRHRQQRMLQIRIASESLRTRHQPQIELVFQVAHFAQQFRVVAVGIIHQVAGMNLEKLRKDLPRCVRQVRPRAPLSICER